MTDLRTALSAHIMTKLTKADSLYPGAYALGLGDGPSLAVFAPANVTLPATYSFQADGQTFEVPVKMVVQSPVNAEGLKAIVRDKATAKPAQKAA